MRTLKKETIERYAAAGAVLVALGLIAFFAFFVFLTFPTGNGIDTTQAIVSWVAVGLLIIAVVMIHLVFARMLFRDARSSGSA